MWGEVCVRKQRYRQVEGVGRHYSHSILSYLVSTHPLTPQELNSQWNIYQVRVKGFPSCISTIQVHETVAVAAI